MSFKLSVQPTARLLRERGYLVIGEHQLKILQAARAGKKLKITPTGPFRKHNFADLDQRGLLDCKKDLERGEIDYVPTRLAIRALDKGQLVTAKLPPSGYRKVRRGRPATTVRRAA